MPVSFDSSNANSINSSSAITLALAKLIALFETESIKEEIVHAILAMIY